MATYGPAARYIFAFVALSTMSTTAWADSFWNNPGTGDWLDPANWSGGVPDYYSEVYIENGGTAQHLAGSGAARNFFISDGELQILGGTFQSQYGIYLAYQPGTSGHLLIEQTGHLVLDKNLIVGWFGTGTAEMSGGDMTVHGRLIVGDTNGSHGTFMHTGGAIAAGQIGEQISIASGAGSYGRYELSGDGTIDVYNMHVGQVGQGEFIQTSGVVTVVNDMNIGVSEGSGTLYELMGDGSLSSRRIFIGGSSGDQNGMTGRVVQSSPLTVLDVQFMYIGLYEGGTASYELAAGTLNAQEINLGLKGEATFVQSGGLVNAGTVHLRSDNLGVGTSYLISGGELETDLLRIGFFLEASVIQDGGQVTADTVRIQAIAEGLGLGLYKIEAGQLDVTDTFLLGDEGDGAFNVVGSQSSVHLYSFIGGIHASIVSGIDTGGISTIQVDTTATIDGTWIVEDLGASAGRFDILQAAGGILGTFDLVEMPGPDWQWGIDDENTLWVEYVPEPTSMALLALGVPVLLRRRVV